MNPSVLATLEARWRTQTLALGPTPLDQAEDRLEFFAAAVQLYDQRGWPMPPTLDALREQLRSIEFAVVRREDDVTRTYRGSDDSLYGFSDGRGNDRRFAFQKPPGPTCRRRSRPRACRPSRCCNGPATATAR